MAWVLLSVFFPLQAKAELSSAAGGIVLGGGMSAGVLGGGMSAGVLGGGMSTGGAGVSAGIPSASPGLQAPSIEGVQRQPLLINADAATPVSQDNVNQVEQTQGGAALNLNNEFHTFLAQSVGWLLPRYGYNLFSRPPSTFAPVSNIPVPQDYLIGPGDEIVLTAWGQVDIDLRVIVAVSYTHLTLPTIYSVSIS